MKADQRQQKRKKRHKKIRAKISGTAKVPRLYVFRSKKHIYVQLINDEKGKTIFSVNDLKLEKKQTDQKSKPLAKEKKAKDSSKKDFSFSPVDSAREVGRLTAKKAKEIKVEKVIFDRGGYKYHGRVKAVAEGAREEGLKF